MTANQRSRLRAALQRRIEDVRKSLQNAESQLPTIEVALPDAMDRAAGSYEKEMLLEKTGKDRKLLQHLLRALASLDEESFGECVVCGEEITFKRLEAVPWTRYCIKCQQRLEHS